MRTPKNLLSFIAMFLIASVSVFSQGETEITADELKKFASALGSIQTINQNAQQEMVSAVESAEMDIERFNALSQAQQQPDAKTDASPQEMEKFNSAFRQVQKVQVSAQAEMESNIEKAGLTVERYQEIAMVVQNDPELQQKLQEMMQG